MLESVLLNRELVSNNIDKISKKLIIYSPHGINTLWRGESFKIMPLGES